MFRGELFHRIALRFVGGAASNPFSGGDISIGTDSVRGVTRPGTAPLSGETAKAGNAKTQSRRSWGKRISPYLDRRRRLGSMSRRSYSTPRALPVAEDRSFRCRQNPLSL